MSPPDQEAADRRVQEINERLGILSRTDISRGSLPPGIGADELNALYDERGPANKGKLQEET